VIEGGIPDPIPAPRGAQRSQKLQTLQAEQGVFYWESEIVSQYACLKKSYSIISNINANFSPFVNGMLQNLKEKRWTAQNTA
jgi:hypothetical protein